MSVSKLSEELARTGQDIVLLTTTANGKAELDVPTSVQQIVDGVKVFYFKRLTKDHTHFSPALFRFLHKLIIEEKKAGRKNNLIIHIHAWWNLVSIFSCLVAKMHGIKVVLSPRGMLTSYSLTNRNSKFKDAIHFFLGKKLLRYCHIHATSSKEQKDITETCDVKGITIIPNFVEFPKNTFHQPNNDDLYRLLFLSRIEEKKGLELLFEALTKVSIPWELSIAGSGEVDYIESLQRLASKLNIEHQLKWLGHVPNEQKFELIAQHDVLVLTSYNENFANVVIESLAMGTPVLISQEVGLVDYVLEHNLGWITELKHLEIAEAINNSFKKADERETIRTSAPSIIRQDFSPSKLATRYIDLYNSL